MSVSFRYYKFIVDKIRNSVLSNMVQISELIIANSGTRVSYSGATASNTGGSNPPGEGPANAIDNSTSTKWLDFNIQPIIIDFGSARTATQFTFSTANDEESRDPVRWRLQGSNDNSTWTTLHTQSTDYATTTTRFQQQSWFNFSVSAPTTPTGLTSSSITTSSVTVSWNSSADATSYNLQRDTNTSFTGPTTTTGIVTTSSSVTGLSSGTNYYFRVSAVNSVGTSTYSSYITVLTLPAAPTISSSSISTSGATISWSAITGASSYTLQRSSSSSFTTIDSSLSGIVGTSTSVSGLSSGTTYYYRLYAVNSTGLSSASNTVTLLTLPSTTTISTTSITSSGFTLNWTSVTGASSYIYQRSTDASFTTIDASLSGLSGTSTSITGLSSGTTYYYRMYAVNSSGQGSASNSLTVLTLPSAPTIASSSITATTATISWSAITGASSYTLQRSSSSSFTTIDVSLSGISGTSTSVTGLTANSTYYYRLYAVNTTGQSSASNTLTLLTIPAAPTLTSYSNTGTTLTINWTSVSGATSYTLQRSSTSLFTSIDASYTGLTDISYNITGLSPNTAYYFRVYALSANGTSAASNTLTVPAVNQITDLSANTISYTTLNLSWSYLLGYPSYRILYSTNNFISYSTIDTSNNTYSISGLTSETIYKFRIYGFSGVTNSTVSSDLSITTATTGLTNTTSEIFPTDVSGCQLWFDANDASTLTIVSGKVSEWRDKTANGYKVSQSNSAKRPSYPSTTLNSKNGIQFSYDTILTEIGSSMPNFSSSSEQSVFMVIRSPTGTNSWQIINTMWFNSSGTNASMRYHFSLKDNNTTGITLYTNSSGKLLSGSTFPSNTNGLFGFTVSNSSSLITYNGTTTTGSGATLTSANNATTLFVFGDPRNLITLSDNHIIYEFIGFNRSITTSEREYIEGYLAHKWGISSNLPVGHTYKSTAPTQKSGSNINSISPSTSIDTFLKTNLSTVTGREYFKDFLRYYKNNLIGTTSTVNFGDLNTLLVEKTTNDVSNNQIVDFRIFNNGDTISIPKDQEKKVYYFSAKTNDYIYITIDSTPHLITFDSSGIIYSSTNYRLNQSLALENKINLKVIGNGSSALLYNDILNTTTMSSSNITTNSVNLSWVDISGETGYIIERSSNSGFTTIDASYTTIDISYNITGLSSGTTYYFRVYGINDLGNGPYSNTVTVLTIPSPTSISSSSISTSGFTLNWTSVTGATSYIYQRSTDASFTVIDASLSGLSGTSTTITGLSSGTTYYYRMYAINSSGQSSVSNTLILLTLPSTPTITISDVSANGVIINWTTITGASSYQLEQSSSNTFIVIDASYTSTNTSYSFNNLLSGTTYYFRLKAINSSGQSSNSNIATVLTKPGKVTNLTFTFVDISGITVTWDIMSGVDSYILDTSENDLLTSYSTDTTATNIYNKSSLLSDTEYYFRVKGQNTSGDGEYSNTLNVKTWVNSGITDVSYNVVSYSLDTFLVDNLTKVNDRELFKQYMYNNRNNFTSVRSDILLSQDISGLYINSIDISNNIPTTFLIVDSSGNTNTIDISYNTTQRLYYFSGNTTDFIKIRTDASLHYMYMDSSGIVYKNTLYELGQTFIIDNKLIIKVIGVGSGSILVNNYFGGGGIGDPYLSPIFGSKYYLPHNENYYLLFDNFMNLKIYTKTWFAYGVKNNMSFMKYLIIDFNEERFCLDIDSLVWVQYDDNISSHTLQRLKDDIKVNNLETYTNKKYNNFFDYYGKKFKLSKLNKQMQLVFNVDDYQVKLDIISDLSYQDLRNNINLTIEGNIIKEEVDNFYGALISKEKCIELKQITNKNIKKIYL